MLAVDCGFGFPMRHSGIRLCGEMTIVTAIPIQDLLLQLERIIATSIPLQEQAIFTRIHFSVSVLMVRITSARSPPDRVPTAHV